MSTEYRQKIAGKLRHARQFVVHDVWDVEPAALPSLRAAGVRLLRIAHMVVRGFREDQCPLHASALTYVSLMAIVPILALTLWLARGMGGEEVLKDHMRSAVNDWTRTFGVSLTVESTPDTAPANENPPGDGAIAPQAEPALDATAEQIRELLEQAFEKVENVSFAALGGVGLALLVWMVLVVLGKVEFSFNRVWGISTERSLWRKFTDYLSVLFVLPLLVVAASSLPLVEMVGRVNQDFALALRASLGDGLLKTTTVLLMTCLTFAFLIAFLPNTRVRLKSALAGGVTGGLLFIAWLRICAALQVGVARYGAIYGSFAVVPILLAWVYVSWGIVLFGAEVAFATQNYATYKMERGAGKANIQARIALALAVVFEAARAMLQDGAPFSASEYAVRHRVPVRLLNDMVAELVQQGFLGEISESDGRYTLLKSPETIQVRQLVQTVMQSGIQPEEVGVTGLDPVADRILAQTRQGLHEALTDISVKDALSAAPPATAPSPA
jgi:membrane protein